MKHIINCNVNPKISYDGWKIESHAKMGRLNWDNIKTELYLSEKQKGGYINGEDLLKELCGKNPLNANVLDYLLGHQELIPEDWKGKYVSFFGTTLRSPSGRRYVPCLYWDNGEWDQLCYWLGHGFDVSNPSAVLASDSPLSIETKTSELGNLELNITELIINGRKYKLSE